MGDIGTIIIGLVSGAFLATCPGRVAGWYGSAQGTGATWLVMDVRAAHVSQSSSPKSGAVPGRDLSDNRWSPCHR